METGESERKNQIPQVRYCGITDNLNPLSALSSLDFDPPVCGWWWWWWPLLW